MSIRERKGWAQESLAFAFAGGVQAIGEIAHDSDFATDLEARVDRTSLAVLVDWVDQVLDDPPDREQPISSGFPVFR